MLEEAEVLQPLDLGVVDLVFAAALGWAKRHTRYEIDMDPSLSTEVRCRS
jgi:hypothetical protein